jgi:hypothetical protein
MSALRVFGDDGKHLGHGFYGFFVNHFYSLMVEGTEAELPQRAELGRQRAPVGLE